MAVGVADLGRKPAPSSGRRLLVGTNVVIAVVLAIAAVGVIQYVAAWQPVRWDMTSSSVNSLSDGTENLVRGLKSPIRLTSLYFETDLEDDDQKRYRPAIDNLLHLYESANRSNVVAEWVNPLSDLEKMKKLTERLRSKTAYKDEIAAYDAHIQKFNTNLKDEIGKYLKSENELVASLGGGLAQGGAAETVGQVEALMNFLASELKATDEQVTALLPPEGKRQAAAIGEIKRFYRAISDRLKKLAAFGTAELSRNPSLDAELAQYLKGAGSRSGSLVAAIEEETKLLDELKPMKLDEVMREIRPNGNPILVENDNEALIVSFQDVWPPIDQSAGSEIGFAKRAFKGEERLTSAILRLTHKDQAAVVFVRYGGGPMFFGGGPMGPGQAPYMQMRKQLEEANFLVEEWDLKASTTPPTITPTPTRTIFVVHKPNPPERGPMGQQSPDPPFGEKHKQALLQAMGDNGRALFIGGWEPPAPPNPMSPVPTGSTYEWNDYLKTTWGVSVDTLPLLVEFASVGPGKYVPSREFFALREAAVTDHEIVKGAHASLLMLPWCAPLAFADKTPDGVSLSKLVAQPKKDGVWGIRDIQKYQDQQKSNKEYLTRVADDPEGPFDLGVAATKGDAKMVLISSREFAEDAVAFQQRIMLTSQGLAVQNGSPGNVTLFINSLHWLNDKSDLLNIGKPIDSAVLEVTESSVNRVKAVAIVLWPALALLCGGVAWWVRRR